MQVRSTVEDSASDPRVLFSREYGQGKNRLGSVVIYFFYVAACRHTPVTSLFSVVVLAVLVASCRMIRVYHPHLRLICSPCWIVVQAVEIQTERVTSKSIVV